MYNSGASRRGNVVGFSSAALPQKWVRYGTNLEKSALPADG
jgi:hypothetical protein